jgi:hypothetical protein
MRVLPFIVACSAPKHEHLQRACFEWHANMQRRSAKGLVRPFVESSFAFEHCTDQICNLHHTLLNFVPESFLQQSPPIAAALPASLSPPSIRSTPRCSGCKMGTASPLLAPASPQLPRPALGGRLIQEQTRGAASMTPRRPTNTTSSQNNSLSVVLVVTRVAESIPVNDTVRLFEVSYPSSLNVPE